MVSFIQNQLKSLMIRMDTDDDTNDTDQMILVLQLIKENPSITQKELKTKVNVSIATIKR